jgi:hypothetical protein
VVPSQRSAGPSGYMSADSTRYTLKLVMKTSRADGLGFLDDGIGLGRQSMEPVTTSVGLRCCM